MIRPAAFHGKRLFCSHKQYISKSRRRVLVGMISTGVSLFQIQHAYCDAATATDSSNEIMDMIKPMAGQISYGVVLGGCAGYAAKKMTKVAAFAVGGVFLGLQGLAYNGYISVNWEQIEQETIQKLDQDGDGDFDGDDVKLIIGNLYDFVKFQLPGAGGFATGLVLGLKWG